MTLSHSQARLWIEQAADGLLNPAQQGQLAEHLKGCADCRAFAAEFAQLEHEIGNALKTHWGSPTLPKGSHEKLLKKLGKKPALAGLPKFPLLFAGIVGILIIAYLLLTNFGQNVAGPASPTSTLTASLSPSSTASLTTTVTPTPTATQLVLIAVPQQNANCREGNSSQFEVADTLQEGEHYSPIGRGRDNLWVLFNGPTFQTKCWVFIENLTLQINGDEIAIADVPESLLPFVPYPPTPTPVPTATFTPEPFTPECSDGIDNDGDRRIDLNDTSCSNANDNDELN